MMWEWGGPNDYNGQCADLAAFKHGRSAGMPWAAGIEQNGSHDPSQSRVFTVSYIDGMLSRRLPASGSTPLPLDTTTMWYGCSTGVNQFSVYPASSFTGNRAFASLLPNEACARHWRRAMQAAYDYWHVVDTTPPEAPVKLRATASQANGISLEWDILPDLESCAKNYRIFRNGTMVYDWCQATGKSELQPTGGGDDVSSGERPEMKYVDKSITWGSTYTYEVTTINRADLESARSTPLAVNTSATDVARQGIVFTDNQPVVRSRVNGRIDIKLPNGSWKAKILGIDGREIKQQPASGLQHGIYLVRITNSARAATSYRLQAGLK
jgi:hypothetical protein